MKKLSALAVLIGMAFSVLAQQRVNQQFTELNGNKILINVEDIACVYTRSTGATLVLGPSLHTLDVQESMSNIKGSNVLFQQLTEVVEGYTITSTRSILISLQHVATVKAVESNRCKILLRNPTIPILVQGSFAQVSAILAKNIALGFSGVLTDSTLTGDGSAPDTLKIAQQGATTGQVLTWNGTTWVPDNPTGGAGSGHVLAADGVAVAQKDTADFVTGDISFQLTNTSTTTEIVGSIEPNVIDSTHIINGGISVKDIGQHSASSGQVLKWNGTQWAPAADNDGAGTVGNLTAASTKVTITGGTGAVIGSGTTVDVNQSNLTIDDIPVNRIAFGNATSDGITSDNDIKVNSATSGGSINATYGIKINANGNSGVGIDSVPAGSRAFAATSYDATTTSVNMMSLVRENASVAGDLTFSINNRNQTAGADTRVDISSHTNGGDAELTLSTGTSTTAIIGRDNNDNDVLKLTNSAAASTTDLTTAAIHVSTADEVGIAGSAVSGVKLTVTGTARVTTATGTPTTITGRNSSGDIGNVSLATGLTLSSGVITPANDLGAVEGISGTGVAVRTATDTWTTRTITAGTGVSVSNGSGVSGNPTISADTSLLATVNDLNIGARQIAFGSASNSITGSDVLTYETNTIAMNPTANDTLLGINAPSGGYFGLMSYTDPYNGATSAFEIGALKAATRLFINAYEIYPKADFRQYKTDGIGMLGSTGSFYFHPNGDHYNAPVTGDNATFNRNGTIRFLSGGSAAGFGNPVNFLHEHAANDSTGNAFSFYNYNSSGSGVTIADSALIAAGTGDRGTALKLTNAGSLGLKTYFPEYSLDINATDGIRLPRGNTAQRPSGTPEGVARYNTDSLGIEYADGSAWHLLGAGGVSGTDTNIYDDDGNVKDGGTTLDVSGNDGLYFALDNGGGEANNIIRMAADYTGDDAYTYYWRLTAPDDSLLLYSYNHAMYLQYEGTDAQDFFTVSSNGGMKILADSIVLNEPPAKTELHSLVGMYNGTTLSEIVGSSNNQTLVWDNGNSNWELSSLAGLGGIYGGNGTIAPNATSTLTAASTWNVKYSTAVTGWQMNDGSGFQIYSPDQSGFLSVENNSVYAYTDGVTIQGDATELELSANPNYLYINASSGVTFNTDAGVKFAGTTSSTAGSINIAEASTNGTSNISFAAPASLAASTAYTLPSAGSTGLLHNDGSNVWSWSTVSNSDLASGVGGLYKGDGTLASGTTNATLPSSGILRMEYNGGNAGLIVDDANSTSSIFSKSGSNYVAVANDYLTVNIPAAPGTDHTVSGTTIQLTANENQAFGDVCYIDADGEAHLADASAIATARVRLMCTGTVTTGNTGTYLLQGVARDDTWAWTVGGDVYLSLTGTTGNTLTQTAPSATDECVVFVGIATHADRILFNPSPVIIELN